MFIHLHSYSDYSLLRSTVKIKSLIDLALENNMPAIALTDSNNISGSLKFSEYAVENGIQPIIGCDLSIKHEDKKTKILLLVKNGEGYKNLLHILYQSSKRIRTLPELEKKTNGLIALTSNVIVNSIQYGALIKQLQRLFQNNIYINLQRLSKKGHKIEDKLIKIAYDYDLPLVATNQILFSTRNDYEAHDALTCIEQGTHISDTERKKFTSEYYFKSQKEMKKLFADIPEAIQNTVVIAQRCSFIIKSSEPKLPEFPCKNDINQEIRQQAEEGLKLRMKGNIPKDYLERMKYELNIITKMEYSGYFLIVSDFIKWSKSNDIPVGPGRGSGVGSIVAWTLQITDLDPIKFNLIFERFLNPDRISMPDFDIDFCQQKRDLVIKYIQQKYSYVAQIITFGKLQPRAVLRDVGRVLHIPYFQVDKICKMIPTNPVNPVTLSEAIDLDKELKQTRENNDTIKKLLDISLKLEGLYRHASTHAAGIVISSNPLINSIPISYDTETGLPITQYSMKYVEKAGLVKFDFLGLKTLTIINNTCKIISSNFSINEIELDDQKTFELLSKGDSVGVFQLETAFMHNTLQKLKPDSIDDIIALISLNRPGPMDNIPVYIARKHGIEQVEYPHPMLKEVLKDTFGVIIYQEQVMEIAKIIAGYTLGEADILRRAMGKKIKSEMELQQNIFIQGALKNKIEKSKATYIFNLVAKFAGYGFNKSHAAAYALISYQTAYLKAHYLIEFITTCMNLDIQDTDKLQSFCNEAKQHNIKILPPDINKSKTFFTIENGTIRYGLAAIKGVSFSSLESVCTQKYKDISDFACKTELNKRAIENLAKAGAFDAILGNRQQIYRSAERIAHSKIESNQFDFFGTNNLELIESEEWDENEKINYEFDALGFYLSAHPIDKYQVILKQIKLGDSIAGVITKVRIRSTKRGKFAIIALSNPSGVYEITFYNNDLIEEKKDLFSTGKMVVINIARGESGIRGDTIATLQEFILVNLFGIIIYVKNHNFISELPKIFAKRGNTRVTLRVREDEVEVDIALPYAYAIDIDTIINKHEIKIVT